MFILTLRRAMDGPQNLRKHSRLPLELPAFIRQANHEEFFGTTRNISFGGASLKFDNGCPCALDEYVVMGLILEGGELPVIATFNCEVRRLPKPHEICVVFCSTDLESFDHLRNIMLFNAENPDLLIEELTQHPGLSIRVSNDGAPS